MYHFNIIEKNRIYANALLAEKLRFTLRQEPLI